MYTYAQMEILLFISLFLHTYTHTHTHTHTHIYIYIHTELTLGMNLMVFLMWCTYSQPVPPDLWGSLRRQNAETSVMTASELKSKSIANTLNACMPNALRGEYMFAILSFFAKLECGV